MAISRAKVVDQNFIESVGGMPSTPPRNDLDAVVREGFRLTGRGAIRIFESMVRILYPSNQTEAKVRIVRQSPLDC